MRENGEGVLTGQLLIFSILTFLSGSLKEEIRFMSMKKKSHLSKIAWQSYFPLLTANLWDPWGHL